MLIKKIDQAGHIKPDRHGFQRRRSVDYPCSPVRFIGRLVGVLCIDRRLIDVILHATPVFRKPDIAPGQLCRHHFIQGVYKRRVCFIQSVFQDC